MELREKLEAFLVERCDIYPKELPYLFGTFVTCKYLTWTAFAIGGVRFRPMSKIFSQRVAPQVHEQMKGHRWLLDFQRYAGLAKQMGTTTAETSVHRTRRRPNPNHPSTLFEKAGNWYNHYSLMYSTKLAKNNHWVSFSKLLRQDPRLFAVGLTEGLVFYKITAPVTVPATLYGVVKYYQGIRIEEGEVGEGEGEEEEGEGEREEGTEGEEVEEDDITGVEMFESLKDILEEEVVEEEEEEEEEGVEEF